ncbi:MAG: peptidyl-prolyl cis-trans isomerase [Alphaproteobacteria bacterium]|nr:peptidyl-prolyl cis-trans isomerase [Alphaproteobacteria bacterium]MCB9984863.1 peptidyl-prolyl cis-trans isomerase [Micavibrio sp.]
MILRSMRNGFFSAIFLGLLVLGGLSLVMTDWNGMFRNGGITKTDIAIVNGTPIKIAEFNNMANRILRNQRIDPSQAYEMGVLDNILQSEILTRVLALAASDYGIKVEDKHVAKQVQSLITPLVTSETNNKQALQQFLQMQGMTEKGLVELIRSEIETELLKSTIASSVYVPKPIAEDMASYKGATRTIKFIELPNNAIDLPETANEETLKKYYKEIETQYMIPETRDATIAILDTSALLKNISVSDEDVKKYYDDHTQDFLTPEKRILSQTILTKESDALAVKENAIKSKDLKTAVKTVTGETKSYADNISFGKEDLSEEMSSPVFSANKGDIVGPIKSALGYHVMQISDIVPEHTKTLNELSSQIRQQLTEEKSGNEIYKLTTEIEDRLAAGEDYSSLKDEYKLDLVSLKNLKADDTTIKTQTKLDDTQQAAILKKLFQMNAGESSSLTDLTATSFYSVKIDHITSSAPKEFESVKNLIAKRWKEENQARHNLVKAQQIAEDLNSGKNSLEEIAKENSNKVQTIENLGRTPSKDTSGTPNVMKDMRVSSRFMDAPQGKYILSIPTDANSILVGIATNTKLGQSPKKVDEQQVASLKSDLSTTNLMLFISQLEKKYPVKINYNLIDRLYGKSKNTE